MDLIKDDVHKLFMKYLVPSMSIAVAVSAYSIVDIAAIGQGVGPNGTAACAIVLPIFYISSFIALLCGIGGSVLMSHARGEGNHEKGNAYFTASLIFMLLLTVIVWIPGNLFQDAFYRLCGANDLLLPYAKEYGSWIFGFLPFFVFVVFLDLFVRADGSPRFAMLSTLIGTVINIFGDWFFVFPMHMGVKGAALATVLSTVVQTLNLFVYILLKKTSLKLAKPYRWPLAVKKITVTGFGAAVGALAVIAAAFIANNQIMKYLGAAALAVYGMLGTVSALFTDLFSGIGQAAQPIVSQNYGAGCRDRCYAAMKLGMKTAIFFGTVLAAVCAAFPLQIAGIFMKLTPEVAEITPYILRVYCISFLPLAVNMFCIYYLQAVMRAKTAAVVSLLRGIVINGCLLFIFPLIFGGNGIWWAVLVSETVTMATAVGCVLFPSKK